jgi:thiamine pyrophosphate-dependent acetolactate synthase large subunit-like protein
VKIPSGKTIIHADARSEPPQQGRHSAKVGLVGDAGLVLDAAASPR